MKKLTPTQELCLQKANSIAEKRGARFNRDELHDFKYTTINKLISLGYLKIEKSETIEDYELISNPLGDGWKTRRRLILIQILSLSQAKT